MQKENKGITLVALVITIAIMLILAGVTISVSLRGGLFSKASESTLQMQIEAEKEQLLMATLGALGRNGKVDLTKLDSNLPTGFQKIGTGTYKSSTGNIYQVTVDADIILLNGTEGEPEEPDTPVVPPATPTITLSTTQITKEITAGTPETVTLTATLNNANGDLTWTSSDTSVAEISGSGATRTITLKKSGTAIITVKYGTQATATCNITVTEKVVEMATVTFIDNSSEITLYNFSENLGMIECSQITSKSISYDVPVGSTWSVWIFGPIFELELEKFPMTVNKFELWKTDDGYYSYCLNDEDELPIIAVMGESVPTIKIDGKDYSNCPEKITITEDIEIICYDD